MASITPSDIGLVLISHDAVMHFISNALNLLSTKIKLTKILAIIGFVCIYLILYKAWWNYHKRITQDELKQAAGCKAAIGYPHRERIFGLDLLYISANALRKHSFLEMTRQLLHQSNNTIEYLVLGNVAIITSEPENVKTILSLKFSNFGLGQTRKRSLKSLFGEGIFNVDGPIWQHSRAFLRPQIASLKDNTLDIFERHIVKFTTALPKNGSTFDIQELFSCLIMDIATEVFLGESTNVLSCASSNSQGRDFAEAFDYVSYAVCGRGTIDLYDTFSKIFGDRKLKKSFHIINSFIDQMIQNAIQRSRSPNAQNIEGPRQSTFLKELANNTNDSSRIKHDILNLLLAGKDTVTALVSNTWFVLAKRPDIYAKLRAEVKGLSGKPPSGQQLKDLKYVRYVINETLRLFPPVPLNQRTAEVDTFLPLGGGPDGRSPLFVAKGTSVGYSLYAIHRRHDVFGADAEVFRPERWEEDLRPGWAYLPFNGGPRACLGQQYALKKASYVIVRLVQQFDLVESRDPLEWQERLSLTCFSKNGVKVGMFSSAHEL